ncbi:MAG: hypothetical protein FWC91_12675 [Defluviitaleaceae bacterium]|nr:hypothetical protein [Defluviitaleaceae bacterium]
MMIKKVCVTVLIMAVLSLSLLPFYSDSVMAYGYFMETLGQAIPQDDGYLYVLGIGLTDDAWDEVLLYIYDAEIYDLRTGFSINSNEIYEGDYVRVVYEPDWTNVDYPMAQALVIYVHAGEPNTADFVVAVSDNIWYSSEGCVFVTMDGKYRFTITEDTLLLDRYGHEISFEDIVPGMEMFVWAAFVTASFPGQVIPDKIVLLD